MHYIFCVGEIKDGVLHIGSTRVAVSGDAGASAMVPDVLFYDNQLVSRRKLHPSKNKTTTTKTITCYPTRAARAR